MRQFTIGEATADPDQRLRWYVDIDGALHRRFSSHWAAIVATYVAAHDAAVAGDEATIVLKTSHNQVWTFSLMPGPGAREPSGNPMTSADVQMRP